MDKKNVIKIIDLLHKEYNHINLLKNYNLLNVHAYINANNKLNTIMLNYNSNGYNSETEELFIDYIKLYGIGSLRDLIDICFDTININTYNEYDKINLLFKYFIPIKYNITKSNLLVKSKTIIITQIDNSSFEENNYCVKLLITNNYHIITIVGIISEYIPLEHINNEYVVKRINLLKQYTDLNNVVYNNFINSLTIKDIIVYNNEELFLEFNKNIKFVKHLLLNPISDILTKFNKESLYNKKIILLYILFHVEFEYEYICYLLYDSITSNINKEQNIIYESFPIVIKNKFNMVMKIILETTEELCNTTNDNKLSYEQQIILLNVDNSVKERAMAKLHEFNSKSEDTGFKAKQYIEGLLKIPFNKYKNEPILYKVSDIINLYNTWSNTNIKNYFDLKYNIVNYNKINGITELKKNITIFSTYFCNTIKQNFISNIKILNSFIKENKLSIKANKYSNKNATELKSLKQNIKVQLNNEFDDFKNINIFYKLLEKFKSSQEIYSMYKYYNTYFEINTGIQTIENNIKNITTVLDTSVYGHDNAKTQIQRIIGQWMVGEKSGYCLGFEGPPGVGKTSLAKNGVSQCLKDENNNSRPFSFIAIGGSTNSSTFEGHNYTYVGSTWGKIVDILMYSKIMNPIIYIDELDKISKTENGKEIIGLLTHIIDYSQNKSFQDKYFNGIDIDLSKVLFIFSYNDPSQIDHILLDRIHRIKFNRLTILDKIIITNDFLLTDIYNKININSDNIIINDDIIRYIINKYTNESGVRKLKEVIFDIFTEINLNNLQNKFIDLPITITTELIDNILKDHNKIENTLINPAPSIAVVNGLWANSLGIGGILQLEAKKIDSPSFLDLKLTGMQGDVMKESMNIAKSVVLDLITKAEKDSLKKLNTKNCSIGFHVHCPDGATPKDGPSAGGAITTLLYSLLTNKKIDNTIAMTGEINLQHKITKIGGLDTKIIGGINAGVKHFIFPQSNVNDYNLFIEKYKDSTILNGIKFTPVETIQEILDIVIID